MIVLAPSETCADSLVTDKELEAFVACQQFRPKRPPIRDDSWEFVVEETWPSGLQRPDAAFLFGSPRPLLTFCAARSPTHPLGARSLTLSL